MIKKIFLTTAILSAVYLYQNKYVKKREHIINSPKIPKEFDNFKILQVSDIHCDRVGFSDQVFIENIKKEKADIIVITGDILDSYKNDTDYAYNLLAQISEIAPSYFVSGNHELRLPEEYNKIKKVMADLGITHLENQSELIEKDGSRLNLVGIEDFNYFIKNDKDNYYANHRNELLKNYKEDMFNILLAHRPEKFFIYSEIGYDLIFSGHAHGGQWDVPFVGRIFSPSQGFMPKYTHGIYQENSSKMVVSQGLGNSSFSIRLNNFLEYVVVELKSE
ncbi:MAG: metallophosphoesterase [Gemella sp.]|nr:metallophosphoesterase [Gemella sp.]